MFIKEIHIQNAKRNTAQNFFVNRCKAFILTAPELDLVIVRRNESMIQCITIVCRMLMLHITSRDVFLKFLSLFVCLKYKKQKRNGIIGLVHIYLEAERHSLLLQENV